MNFIAQDIQLLASFITSLGVIGGAGIYLYNRFIGAPREKKRQGEADRRNNELKEVLRPFAEFQTKSAEDRLKLHGRIDKVKLVLNEHEDELYDHNNRIIVLETKQGIRKGE